MIAWGNDDDQEGTIRLDRIKLIASLARFAEQETLSEEIARYRYRLRDENDPIHPLNAFVIIPKGHLQVGIYFDDPAYEAKANRLVEGIAKRIKKG